MIYFFYFFAVILLFLGYKSLRGGICYLRFFQKELAKPKSDFTPFCSVIVPCRGLDSGLNENVAALFRQNFPYYEVVFVVDDENDESIQVIKDASRSAEIPVTVTVAGKAENESQKVHNLRHAILQASAESELFVFVDSDARPGRDWLRNLIAPLADQTVGCATGYRWFIQKRGGFSTALRSIWNASIASALGENGKSNFCWGGSTAISRAVFERLDIGERWKGTLSDDFTVTRAMQAANLPIYFVPNCLTATVEDCNFRALLEFTTRQMKITRVYAGHLWKASFIGSLFFTAIFWTGIALLFVLSGIHLWLTLAMLTGIFVLGGFKAWLRLKAVKLILKDYEKEINRQFVPHLMLWAITPVLYLYNCICALLSRKIIWRGIGYELKSATETEILSTK